MRTMRLLNVAEVGEGSPEGRRTGQPRREYKRFKRLARGFRACAADKKDKDTRLGPAPAAGQIKG